MSLRSTVLLLAVTTAIAMPHGLLAENTKQTPQKARSASTSASQPKAQRTKPSVSRVAKRDRMSATKAYLAKKYGSRSKTTKAKAS